MEPLVYSIDEPFEELVKAERTKAQRAAAKKYKLSEKTKETIGTAGSKEREDMPADMFLKPGERKYPWKLGGKPSQKLLVAAYRRAITQNDVATANKARRLLKEHFGKEFETIGKAMDAILQNWDKVVELGKVRTEEKFEKARTLGAKDIKPRRKRSERSLSIGNSIKFSGKHNPEITFSGRIAKKHANGVTVVLKDGSKEFVHVNRMLESGKVKE